MTCQEIKQHLSDYVDEELSRETRERVERHLASCAACQRELQDLQSLVEAAGELGPPASPRRDLWPGIAARLEPARPATTSRWLQLVAAGIALAVLSVPLSVWWVGRDSGPPQAVIDREVSEPSVTVQAELARSEDGTLLARKDLVTEIEKRRDVVTTDTLVVLEENMRLLDHAIGEIRTALEDDPQNLRLRMLLAARYQQERKLLQKVSRV